MWCLKSAVVAACMLFGERCSLCVGVCGLWFAVDVSVGVCCLLFDVCRVLFAVVWCCRLLVLCLFSCVLFVAGCSLRVARCSLFVVGGAPCLLCVVYCVLF